MDEEKLQTALHQTEANVQVTLLLLQQLIAVLPQGEEVLRRFQKTIDDMTKQAPKTIDEEFVVELRARASHVAASTLKMIRDPNAPR